MAEKIRSGYMVNTEVVGAGRTSLQRQSKKDHIKRKSVSKAR